VNSQAQVADPARPAQGADGGHSSKPTLIFFYSPTSGGSRMADGFLAQVLQRRRNHDTFTLKRVNTKLGPSLPLAWALIRRRRSLSSRKDGSAQRSNGPAAAPTYKQRLPHG
jgi:hypothetical protein